MNRFDKYRETIIMKYGSWENYQKERKYRQIEKHGSEKAVEDMQKAIQAKGGRMSTSRPFRDIEGLASRAAKSKISKGDK